MKKICNDCYQEKSIGDFPKRVNYNGTKTEYRVSYCKECWKERTKNWQRKNRDRYLKYQKEYSHNKYKNV